MHRTAAPQPGQVPAARHPEPRSLPFSKPHDDVELLLLELDVGISSKASIPSQQPPAASTAHHSNSNTAPLSTSSLHKALAAAPRATTSKARCSTTYVCGPDAAAAAPGEELPGQAACCSSMRCTKCDFQVVRWAAGSAAGCCHVQHCVKVCTSMHLLYLSYHCRAMHYRSHHRSHHRQPALPRTRRQNSWACQRKDAQARSVMPWQHNEAACSTWQSVMWVQSHPACSQAV